MTVRSCGVRDIAVMVSVSVGKAMSSYAHRFIRLPLKNPTLTQTALGGLTPFV